MNEKIKQIVLRIRTVMPNSYINIAIHNRSFSDKNVRIIYEVYVEQHKHRDKMSEVFPTYNSIEELINDVNIEFSGYPNWKPIPQTKKGKLIYGTV